MDAMFPCVSSWPSSDSPASAGGASGNHAPSPLASPSSPPQQLPLQQPLPDLLCSCSVAPPTHHPPPVHMESLIVVTEYEPSGPSEDRMGTGADDDELEDMDSSETPDPPGSGLSSAATGASVPPFRMASCDLLSHAVGRPEALFPEPQETRGRLHLSDRKLSLQERSQTLSSPCGSPGINGRYIYPSLPYSPITSPHSSPRLPRRPTVESHRVSITDLQVAYSSEITHSILNALFSPGGHGRHSHSTKLQFGHT